MVDTLPSPASLRSDRRLSLPSSIMSASTADFMGNKSTKPEANDFQVRRRRAAKLAQFFGVDYKAVMQEVLDSIERGVEDERQSGALQPEEAEVCSTSHHLIPQCSYILSFAGLVPETAHSKEEEIESYCGYLINWTLDYRYPPPCIIHLLIN